MPTPQEDKDKIAQESKELIEALKQAKLTELLELLSPKNDDKTQTQSPKDIFESFLEREDVNKADQSGYTILHCAAANGYKNIVESLLPKMTPEAINKVNIEGNTAFDDVVLNESFDPVLYKDIAKLLIEKMDEKAISRSGNDGRTPLHWAAAFGLKDSVESLLPKMTPDEINKADKANLTPLYYAVKTGNQDVIKVFIAHEFNNTKLSAGKVPLSQIKGVAPVKGPQESGGRI